MKIRIAFVAIALFAIASAFTTRAKFVDVFQKAGTNNYILLDPSKRGVSPGGWDCDISTNTCTYKLKTIHGPQPYQDSDMELAEQGTFVQL